MDYIRIYDTNCAMFLYPAYLQIVTQKKWHTLCHVLLLTWIIHKKCRLLFKKTIKQSKNRDISKNNKIQLIFLKINGSVGSFYE